MGCSLSAIRFSRRMPPMSSVVSARPVSSVPPRVDGYLAVVGDDIGTTPLIKDARI